MKKIFTLALLASTFSTFAATEAVLNLSGTVESEVAISIDGGASADYTLEIVGETSDKETSVGSIAVSSNDEDGFEIDVTSENNYALVHADGDSFSYTLDLDGLDELTTETGVHSSTHAITAKYNQVAASTLSSGEYTDKVTFEITAK